MRKMILFVMDQKYGVVFILSAMNCILNGRLLDSPYIVRTGEAHEFFRSDP